MKFELGAGMKCDLEILLESRMLIQATSGGGKSRSLRRILEQTHGKVQQIIIDPEGELVTLREQFDYVLAAAHGGDTPADPRSAALLAERLLELGASAIVDLSELKHDPQVDFVKRFCVALIEAPKRLRHPILLPIDEIQLFAPEGLKCDSTLAVIDVATRGRKRGLCLVAATQRISDFAKSAAAQLKNKLVGNTVLDVDVKRSAFELGVQPKEAMAMLRGLNAGEFYGFGPALSATVRILKTGNVETTHPKVGHRQALIPPKPTEAIMAVLPKLADLPKEAEQELRTAEDLRKELSKVRRELTTAKRAQPAPVAAPVTKGIDPRRHAATVKRLQEAIEALMKFIVEINAKGFAAKAGEKVDPAAIQKAIESAVGQAIKMMEAKLDTRNRELATLQRDGGRLVQRIQSLLASDDVKIAVTVAHQEPFAVTPAAKSSEARQSKPARAAVTTEGVGKSQQKLLDSLAWLESKGLYPAPKNTLAAVAHVSPTSGGYFNNLGSLRSAGLIDYPTPGAVGFTDEGRAIANAPEDDGSEVHEHWLKIVSAPQAAILNALIKRHPETIHKDELAHEINVSETSGGYFNNLGSLRTLGAIDYPQKGFVGLTRYVMPE